MWRSRKEKKTMTTTNWWSKRAFNPATARRRRRGEEISYDAHLCASWRCSGLYWQGKRAMDGGRTRKSTTWLNPSDNNNLAAKKVIVKNLARVNGENYVELPAKVVFTKPNKYKIRIVACGNQTDDAFGKIPTTDLDSCMLRLLLSWGPHPKKCHSGY